MKALSLFEASDVRIVDVAEPNHSEPDILLQVEFVGLCGSDLNAFRGRNPLVTYPRVLGHEIAATVLEGNATLVAGSHVTVLPYTSCGHCSACLRGERTPADTTRPSVCNGTGR